MNSQFSPGAMLGPYELLLPLPRTGAAQVYVARFHGASGFRTRVALKTIPRGYLEDVPTEHLLREQSSLAAQIRHPNLVEALDVGEESDTLYVAMEWVDGEPLQALITEAATANRMPIALAVNIAGQLCRGLHAIHDFRDARGNSAGAVHGHVSPQNLLLSYNGTAKLCDFGIARAMDRISFLTRASQQFNKLTFIAPEQLSARPVDARSDVFSAGTLLYMLTTARHPFEGDDVRQTLDNICSNLVAPLPGSVCPGYPEELGTVIAKAIRKAPEERWASALDFARALERAVPDGFHASSEQRLAEYLEEFFAAHKLAFHARIHAAEQQQDKLRSLIPAAPRRSSLYSLRAVSLDMAEPENPALELAQDDPAPRLGTRFALRGARALGLALPVAAAAGFVLWRGFAPSVDHGPGAALVSENTLPPPAVVLESTRPPAPIVIEPVAAEPSPLSPSPVASVDISELPPEPVRPAARARSAAPAPRAVVTKAAAPASTHIPASPATNAQGSVPPSAASVNPWDPSTFGGRH